MHHTNDLLACIKQRVITSRLVILNDVERHTSLHGLENGCSINIASTETLNKILINVLTLLLDGVKLKHIAARLLKSLDVWQVQETNKVIDNLGRQRENCSTISRVINT